MQLTPSQYIRVEDSILIDAEICAMHNTSDSKTVWQDIHDVVCLTLLPIVGAVAPAPGCFEILVFDVMLDDSGKVRVRCSIALCTVLFVLISCANIRRSIICSLCQCAVFSFVYCLKHTFLVCLIAQLIGVPLILSSEHLCNVFVRSWSHCNTRLLCV